MDSEEMIKMVRDVEILQQAYNENKGKLERLENENDYLRGLVDKFMLDKDPVVK